MDLRWFLGLAISLFLVWALLVMLLWLLRPRGTGWTDALRVIPDVLRLVRALLADRTTPPRVRVALVGLALYLLNPIDLIPEFVPVIGPLDDVVVAVLVLRYVRRRMGDTALRARWPGTEESYRLLERIIG